MSDDIVNRLRRHYVETGANHVQEAADKIERLRAALRRYGGHDAGCPYDLPHNDKCLCGFLATLFDGSDSWIGQFANTGFPTPTAGVPSA